MCIGICRKNKWEQEGKCQDIADILKAAHFYKILLIGWLVQTNRWWEDMRVYLLILILHGSGGSWYQVTDYSKNMIEYYMVIHIKCVLHQELRKRVD